MKWQEAAVVDKYDSQLQALTCETNSRKRKKKDAGFNASLEFHVPCIDGTEYIRRVVCRCSWSRDSKRSLLSSTFLSPKTA